MEKQELRKWVRTAKREVPLEVKIQRSAPILREVEQLPEFVAAKTVLLYWSMDDEVATHDFVERWWQKKCLLLPCVDGDTLKLRQYTGPLCMQAGPEFGIGEPTGEVFSNLDEVDMIVVPGVAFDKKNNRMGRGRGFYDRLLKQVPNAFKVGVAFNFQLFDTIPTDPFDVPMDKVIVEKSI